MPAEKYNEDYKSRTAKETGRKTGIKPTKKEQEARIHDAALQLCSGKRPSEIQRNIREKYGVCYATARNYINAAQDQVKADFSRERDEFLATRLGILEKVIAIGMETNQLGSVVGAVRLAMEATGTAVDKR